MDETYKTDREDKKLTEPKVKEIVSSEIQKALKLNNVSPDLIYPLCGEFAFQVCHNEKLCL